ncbi:DUF998 domain-containing protein [uncultured Dysosmobacter sp.]|uniref:DUF998 domain-containing protein n=1 Tax=uncultured Dysosmobacter sp. TaxID=2591384 RepID=UPI00262927F4|nr:DUF998 domain-containing protein [uncultured Dysosmobacter sp.]
MKLSRLGLFGVISLLSYAAMVVFSPLAYPGYDWLSMAVSDLSAVGAPSAALASRLNALFAPCGIVSIMAVCVSMEHVKERLLRLGVYLFCAMEWVCTVGYELFPWVAGADGADPQNIMHLLVTVLVVIFSIASLVLIALGARKGAHHVLSVWAVLCLALMLLGAVGTGVMPKAVFGLFERFSTFAAVIFNAVLGGYLFIGNFDRDFGREGYDP